jgi:hypothetical protein
MGSSSYYERNRMEATSTQPGGGCFSAIFSPLFLIFGIIAFFRLATGETTRPWDLMVDFKPMESVTITVGDAENSTIPKGNQRISSFFAPSVLYWEKDILRWAAEWDLDPNLVATVMQIESCGDPRALSNAGAMGLFQVMPYHFTSAEAPYNPDTNALRGMAYLQKALNTYQSDRLAFASYNGGIGTAAKPEAFWPNETVRYTYWGTGIYQDAHAGKQYSPRLEEWFAAGGASLCRQAAERLGID